ncbi:MULTISPECIES: hypothetical protein [unclassified Mesorhizobium]|uniref:hypothetical protein n=1 Tax=unclassified Mesorhizobium TaxID=325217 RepID=UPI0003CFB234|nr:MULTISPECIES: hypothetical protein [unclassified Mesorhizobium]ESZ23365.1 hypothetical protein X734_26845 [Mesorhizobium sp. L2C084A000]RUW88604.1 hypothetical protein EOA19_29075 [Mesorhizobium sp. M7A.F.Ca.US.010.02.1.1]
MKKLEAKLGVPAFVPLLEVQRAGVLLDFRRLARQPSPAGTAAARRIATVAKSPRNGKRAVAIGRLLAKLLK